MPVEGSSLDAGKGLASVEAEGRVKRERAIVICGLHQSHPCRSTFPGSVHHRLHELASDSKILCVRIDGYWANSSDQRSLIETIASHDATIAFRNHTIKSRMRE